MSDITASTWWGSKNRYSTDEQIVGEWIDGKPIYQKTITGLNVNTTANTWVDIVDVSSLSIECAIFMLPFLYINGESCNIWETIRIRSNKVQIISLYSFGINGITLQYTKTTD